jgi:FAD synthase
VSEQRRAVRRRTLIGARVFVGKTGTLDGTVRNMSETGAKIVFPLPTATPDEFEVEIADHGRFRVRAMWRNGTAIGVQFVQNAKAA